MICRDEEEAELVAARLAEDVPVKNGAKGETEEFGDGVMVLPVSYTKGLEFDAVLLFDPSEKKYPSDNGHVKLLYVAATRALHELTILHRGSCPEFLRAGRLQDKHIKEFAAEPLTKAREYEKPVRTKKEQMQQRRVEGAMDMAEREYFGPRRIAAKAPAAEEKPVIRPAASPAVRPQTETVRGQQAKTVHRPQTGAMHRPQAETVRGQQDMATVSGAGREASGTGGNQSVPVCIRDDPGEYQSARSGARKGKSCGPVGKKEQILCRDGEHVRADADYAGRSGHHPGQLCKRSDGKNCSYGLDDQSGGSVFMERQGTKSVVEIAAGEITVRVDKRSGAVSFWNRENQLLLAENAAEPESDRRGGKLGIFRLGQERAHQGKGHARYGFSGCDIKCALYILRREKA